MKAEWKKKLAYLGYGILILGFFWVVLFMTDWQQPSRRMKRTRRQQQRANTTQYVDSSYDDEDSETGKVSIGPGDIDTESGGDSEPDLSALIASNNVEDVEEVLNSIAFDEKWTAMENALEVLYSIDGWTTNVSGEIQMAYVSALKDFMPMACSEYIPFLLSSDEDVKETVSEEIVDYIRDLEDEHFAASLIVKFSPLVKDSDFADGLVLKIESMDAELAALAMIGVIRNGSSQMKESLRESMEFITDQPEMTEQAVLKWVAEQNDDGESDSAND